MNNGDLRLTHRSRSPNPDGAAIGRQRAELAPLQPRREPSIHSMEIDDGVHPEGVPDDLRDEEDEKGRLAKRGSTDPLVAVGGSAAGAVAAGRRTSICRQCPCSRATAVAITTATLCLGGMTAAAAWWLTSGEAGPASELLPASG